MIRLNPRLIRLQFAIVHHASIVLKVAVVPTPPSTTHSGVVCFLR
ncbi:hypothetical protein A2U01_0103246, partial [Trifolium medium]|nr:hypothetical protein [Trifolium medium]